MLLTTQFLGTGGRGEVVIITSTITIIMLLNGFIGSSALVYLTPKRNFYQLLVPSYLWALFSSFVVYFLLTTYSNSFIEIKLLFGETNSTFREDTIFHIVILGFLGSLFEINLLVVLGKEKILTHNLLGLGRVLLIFVILGFLFFVNTPSVSFYIQTLHIVYFTIFISSCFVLVSFKEKIEKSGFFSSGKDMLKYGFQDQLSTILHFLNYRISVYALFFIYSKTETGIFSVALFLMEGVLLISNSISLVQYSKIVNSSDRGYNERLTLDLSKLTFLLLLGSCVILASIPSDLYQWMVGKDFTGINWYFTLLTPGIVAFGTTQVFCHYYCSLGQFYHNIIANALGMIASLIGCYIIIPAYGIEGACLTISVTYLIVATYLIVYFFSKNKLKAKTIFSLPKLQF